jgi:hypothetical protein
MSMLAKFCNEIQKRLFIIWKNQFGKKEFSSPQIILLTIVWIPIEFCSKDRKIHVE